MTSNPMNVPARPDHSTSPPRHVLYLRPDSSRDSLDKLIAQRGWVVDCASCQEEARELVQDKHYCVGLIHWDGMLGDCAHIVRQVEELNLVDRCTNLVALLENMAGRRAPLAPILHRYFYDYHTLPVDPERLLVTLGHAHGMAQMAREATPLHEADALHGMLGNSPPMQTLYRSITRVATTDFNVLITGESGTGKELAANAIHRMSARAEGPFVAVNCGALPRDLIQAELFGHEKGAFTGADSAHKGKIEAAQYGSLFLDEIGDLPLELQTNLLRFLQERSIVRVGGTAHIAVNVRTIAATNVDLEKAVEEGRFRQDLYYRLNVLKICTPPLRERGDDILILAKALFDEYAQNNNPALKGFTDQALNYLKTYYWPGNVRELTHRVQRAVVMCEGKLIGIRDLGRDESLPLGMSTLAEAREAAEKEIIEATLARLRNNVSRTARQLDISRVTLYRLMEAYGIAWQSQKKVFRRTNNEDE